MNLNPIDIGIIVSFLVITFIIGFSTTHSSGKNKEEFFLGGRSMPWWLLGFSMVATTFSVDTPNLVTNLVRTGGVSSNWSWWAMLPGGMLTVFLYANLWRRSEVLTDIEFYELRYSGKLATFLRKFRTVFIGLFFTIISIANITLALIKVCGVVLNFSPILTIVIAMGITTAFSAAGGLKGVLLSDMLLFVLAMIASVVSAIFVVNLPEIGGLSTMIQKLAQSPENVNKMGIVSFGSVSDFISMFLIPISLVWWSVWYAGAEPGGGSFVAQRMLAAKDENHAVKATLFFNILHYSIRPWPWMLVALASLVLYPNHEALVLALKGVVPEHQIGADVAYSLMINKIPHGWLGLVITSMVAAYVSTLSTLLNLSSGYFVNDLYVRFINPAASSKKQVFVGRFVTVVIAVLSAVFSLFLNNALDVFQFLLSFGAGTGLIFMLRWFWWRINALSELIAMISAFVFSIYFTFVHQHIFPNVEISWAFSLVLQTILVTICWVVAAYLGPKTDKDTLIKFYKKTKPAGYGWNYVIKLAKEENIDVEVSKKSLLKKSVFAAFCGTVMIYSILFLSGEFIYGRTLSGILYSLLFVATFYLTLYMMKNIRKDINK
ncbi:MAG: Na+:solute symporter [Alphaproteobacteria bacterium]|nr:Na+:solute symporter [Alphaproteobacteria bacterium]